MTTDTKVKARFTTLFNREAKAVFSGPRRTMTAGEAVEEYRDLLRGGTYVGADVVDADGKPISIGDIEFELRSAAWDASHKDEVE